MKVKFICGNLRYVKNPKIELKDKDNHIAKNKTNIITVVFIYTNNKLLGNKFKLIINHCIKNILLLTISLKLIFQI